MAFEPRVLRLELIRPPGSSLIIFFGGLRDAFRRLAASWRHVMCVCVMCDVCVCPAGAHLPYIPTVLPGNKWMNLMSE